MDSSLLLLRYDVFGTFADEVYLAWDFRCLFTRKGIWSRIIEDIRRSSVHVTRWSRDFLYIHDIHRRRWTKGLETKVHGGAPPHRIATDNNRDIFRR